MSPKIEDYLRKASNKFSLDLYQQVKDGVDSSKNIVISPISIQSLLSLVMMGADGKTKEEMKKGLGYSAIYSDTLITSIQKTFMDQMARTKVLQVANAVYLKECYQLKDDFKDLAKTVFNADTVNVDFSKKQEVVKMINSWASKKTNGKIRDMIEEEAIHEVFSIAFLLNTVYFKADWLKRFQAYFTRQNYFYINNKEKVLANFMTQTATFRFGQISQLDASVLELPYEDRNISMMIILPNTRTGLAKLEMDITKVNIFDIRMDDQYTEIFLPKFKFEFGANNLVEALKSMGMNEMFSDRTAEFTQMLKDYRDLIPLHIGNVIQQALIEVDEEGTEAAAFTSKSVRGGYSNPSPPPVFRADHPFMFILKSQEAVLFMGRVIRP